MHTLPESRARYFGRGGIAMNMPKYLIVLRDFGNFAANQSYGEDTPRRIARYMIHCNATEQMELPPIPHRLHSLIGHLQLGFTSYSC